MTGSDLQLVLHIGPHKTGSTYLQTNFAAGADALKERGWYYPRLGGRVGIAHHDLSDARAQFAAGEGPALETFRKVLAKADEQRLNLLLSSEGFGRWTGEHVEGLRSLIGARSLRLVYFLRDPLDRFYSMWSQGVRSGRTKDFSARMDKHLADPGRSRMLNPLVDIRPLLELPDVAFETIHYDELQRRRQDIHEFFVREIVGIANPGPPPTPRVVNERLPLEMTEFLRLLSIESGYVSGRRRGQPNRVGIAELVQLTFSERDKERIVETMRQFGGPARRTIEIPRTTPEYLSLQAALVDALGPTMRPPPRGTALFPTAPAVWAHYDEEALRAIPEVRQTLAWAAERIRPGSVRLRVVTAAKRLILWSRQVRKRLVLGAGTGDARAATRKARRRGRRRR